MTKKIQRIAVYCGAYVGHSHHYKDAAIELSRSLVENHIGLVFGGSKVGLMGVIADEVLKLGGEVIGVIPELLLQKELAHEDLTELHVVKNMHERKALMSSFADAFIMFPGGTGTLDEFFEMWVQAQLGIHKKPCGILNVHGYYNLLIQFINQTVVEGFIQEAHKNMLIIENSAENLLSKMLQYQAPLQFRWEEPKLASNMT